MFNRIPPGKRVILRPLAESDIPLLLKWLNDNEVTRYLDRWVPFTKKDAHEWLTAPAQHSFIVVLRDRNERIGVTRIHSINERDKRANTTTIIGEHAYRGKGFGVEVKLLLLHHAFEVLGLHKVYGRVYQSNIKGLRYNEKCGYRSEGVLKQHKFRNGTYHDIVLIGVFKCDWKPFWERYIKKNMT